MKRRLSSLLLFVFITAGCYSTETVESTRISANDVYQSYFVVADKDYTAVSATFRVGGESGATIDLDAPSRIEYNGKPMLETSPGFMKGTTYETSVDQFVGRHAFAFTNADGKTFRHDLIVEPLEIRASSFKISRSEKTLIALSRAAAANEEVSAFLTGKARAGAKNNSAESAAETTTLKLDESRSAIVVEPADIRNLSGGRASLSLKAGKKITLEQEAGKGGVINCAYEAQDISVTIPK